MNGRRWAMEKHRNEGWDMLGVGGTWQGGMGCRGDRSTGRRDGGSG